MFTLIILASQTDIVIEAESFEGTHSYSYAIVVGIRSTETENSDKRLSIMAR